MLCEKCGRRKSVIFYRENIGGKVSTFNLCAECADSMKRSGELEDFSAALTGLGYPLLAPEDTVLREIPALTASPDAPQGSICPRCGASLSDISASAGAGCADCYAAFARELEPLLNTYGGRLTHIGAVPAGYRARRERARQAAALRTELSAAVKAERFEDAVALRDRIRKLEKEGL